ncbi:unnamed protein product [Rotaria socialis]|uniref:Uncharacterized protein n=2 Tax=Rotaria socialis TaxID=392032 RepID=A0A821KDW8_9BILA|nr:unnamed protein product [Rotaria socialis]
MTLKWRSFDEKPDVDFEKIYDIDTVIAYLYAQLSEKHGQVLFIRAMAYLQQADGLSETELEDMLSSDDDVLQSVFAHYLPPLEVFRLPSTLWIRIRNDMQKYFVERDEDNIPVIYFYHRCFREFNVFCHWDKTEVSVKRVQLEYYTGNIGEYANLNKRPFEIKNEKLKNKYPELEKYKGTTLPVTRGLTEQESYVKNTKGKGRVYNMRRIKQLYKDIEYPLCEPYFLYDYDFMSSFFHCYKISEMNYRCRGNSRVYPQLRFNLELYKASYAVLGNHPGNFAFEICSLLAPFMNVLSELTYNLLQQCRSNCMLQSLSREIGPYTSCVSRFMVGVAYNISWQSSCLFVLGTEKVCIHDFNGRIDEYVWPSKEVFTAFKQRGCFICLYSAHSLLLYDYVYSEKCRLQLDAEEFVHIDLIRLGGNDVLLVCSRDSKSIDLWGFYDGVPKKKYPFERFDECIVECSTLITYSGTLIKITLKNGRIHYLHSNKGSFQTVATLNKKPGKQSILLNFTTDVYYSEGHSYIDLYHFNGAASSESNPFQRISNLPHVGNRCSRISCRKTSSMQNIDDALIWFTSKYAVIVDFYCSHIVIPGEYTGICEIHVSLYDFSNLFGNFICCLKKDKTGINIFEWRCDKGVHMYRLLAFLELDQKIFNCVCSIDWYSGIAVYCALEDGELRRYNATMMASLPDRPAPFSKSPILKEQISHLQIQDKILLTLDESKRVHSSGSSFLIIDSNMRQLLHIDTKLPLTLNNVADLKITCRSLLSATVPERSILYILSDDQSTLTIWDSEKNTIKYHLIHLEKTIKVQKLYALSSALVFHDSDQRVHLWYIDADKTTITLERTNHLEVKSTRLVLFHQTVKKLIIYDVDKKLCGKIQVESPCDAFCFTTDEKYLFVISHDESMLQMYEVDTGKMLEKLFIENMSPLIQATNDHLFLFCNNKLLLMSITGRSSLNRDTKVSPAMCPLFEEQYWLWTHKDKPWTVTSYAHLN